MTSRPPIIVHLSFRPIWLILGFLTAWVHFQPNPIVILIWGAVLYAMIIWIMRSIKNPPPDQDIPT